MIEPNALLATARFLVDGAGTVSQARLRRAISSAYYALFHEIARQATNGLVGVRYRNAPRYTTVYRSFEHRHMQEACTAVDKSTLGTKAAIALGKTSASQEIRDVASAFRELQERRHWADYSPTGNVTRADARDLIAIAELALKRLSLADDAERQDFLAYLMLPVRAG